MKIEIESQDIEAIAQRVTDSLRPMLSGIERREDRDVIFDVKGLAEYLHVDPSWLYKQISFKTIPYFKAGKYSRFRKRDIDKWIETGVVRPIPNPKMIKGRG